MRLVPPRASKPDPEWVSAEARPDLPGAGAAAAAAAEVPAAGTSARETAVDLHTGSWDGRQEDRQGVGG